YHLITTIRLPPTPTLFPYTTLFRSDQGVGHHLAASRPDNLAHLGDHATEVVRDRGEWVAPRFDNLWGGRSAGRASRGGLASDLTLTAGVQGTFSSVRSGAFVPVAICAHLVSSSGARVGGRTLQG